jgi:hypothetical protein
MTAAEARPNLGFQMLRWVLVAHCCALLAQPSLAGEFLSGTDGVVKFHEWTGWAILALCLLQIGFAALAMRTGAVSWWLVIGSVFVLMGEMLQAATGYVRFLRVHVPLGVVLFGAVLLQTIAVFRAGYRK